MARPHGHQRKKREPDPVPYWTGGRVVMEVCETPLGAVVGIVADDLTPAEKMWCAAAIRDHFPHLCHEDRYKVLFPET